MRIILRSSKEKTSLEQRHVEALFHREVMASMTRQLKAEKAHVDNIREVLKLLERGDSLEFIKYFYPKKKTRLDLTSDGEIEDDPDVEIVLKRRGGSSTRVGSPVLVETQVLSLLEPSPMGGGAIIDHRPMLPKEKWDYVIANHERVYYWANRECVSGFTTMPTTSGFTAGKLPGPGPARVLAMPRSHIEVGNAFEDQITSRKVRGPAITIIIVFLLHASRSRAVSLPRALHRDQQQPATNFRRSPVRTTSTDEPFFLARSPSPSSVTRRNLAASHPPPFAGHSQTSTGESSSPRAVDTPPGEACPRTEAAGDPLSSTAGR
ncbi:Acp42 [Striga asiatica]|uniref:Acp42 n=1 Tax=Striga asiatica TaxID=4170 RepID=A0A5A7P3J6_STRAF|nr:Acp42 [Striga asiatica]